MIRAAIYVSLGFATVWAINRYVYNLPSFPGKGGGGKR